jgi:integrase
MSDQGSATVKGRPRVDGSAAKARCRVLAFTGMRPSELMRYRPEHWDRKIQTLVVFTGKGGRTRTIPLSTPAVEALEALEALGAIGPFSTSAVRRAFVRAAERLGFHGVRPYDLRHSFGTALYRAAGDTRLVKDLLGHSDSRMTERYTLGHVPEAMRAATAVFESQFGGSRNAADRA